MKRANLIKERKKRKWTQAYVASMVGMVTRGGISNIENGQKDPSYDIVCKLEELYPGFPFNYSVNTRRNPLNC